MSISAVIVDDEQLARDELAYLLKEVDVDVVAQGKNGVEAVNLIKELSPDLVFLDVQMPECDGFDVLEQLGGALPAALVFVTAYDQYALQAFEAGALDYLLKPFDDARFATALRRAKEKILAGRGKSPRVERLAIKNAGEVLFVKIAEIDWIEAADYYVCLHVGVRTHLLRRSMADVEKELEARPFCRVHRSAIVNLERVRRLVNAEDGGAEVELCTGAKLRVSRRYRRAVEERMG